MLHSTIFCFRESICAKSADTTGIGTQIKKHFAKMCSLHPPDAEHKGFGHGPTSILNLIFRNQIQKLQVGTSLHCLLSKSYLLFLPLLILQSGKGKMAVSAKKNRKRPRLNLHSWCDPSWPWLHKEYKLTFPGWCCKLLLVLANHKEGAHT